MWREFRRNTKTAELYWKIRQDGESYTTEHGQVGTDNPQTFSDTPGSKGKEDTKAFVSAVDNCTFNVTREIRKKTEHGYIEYVNGKPLTEEVKSISFDKHLPKNFCGYKPQTSITDSSLNKIHKAGNAWYTRKYDGLMHLAVKHTWGWELYSRRMDITSDRFPKHIKELSKLDFEVGTILVGEMICHTPDGRDDFKAISRVCRSDAPKSRQLIEDGECPEPTYRVFDMLYHNGKSLANVSFGNRYGIWSIKFITPTQINDTTWVAVNKNILNVVDVFDLSPDTWEQYAKDHGWEGFVVVDTTAVPGDKFFSFDGDAKRPKGHHKLKPIWEDDVVVYAAVKGSGKRLNTIGSVLVKQIHPETKQWFRCGKVGSGFTDEDIVALEKELKENNLPIFDKEKEDKAELDDNGIVAMIEFGERQPGTNKFRFPVFMRTRYDKTPKECVAQRLAPEEE